MAEVSAITGHKTLSQLGRYLRAEDLVKKLDNTNTEPQEAGR